LYCSLHGRLLEQWYQDLLGGSYDCVDRIVLNAYYRIGHDPGGFRLWWRQLTGSDETLDNTHLMRMAGHFSRRIRGYARAHNIPVIDSSAGDRKHDLAEEHVTKTKVTQVSSSWLAGPKHQYGTSARTITSSARSRCRT
jgi:hypothetical protein